MRILLIIYKGLNKFNIVRTKGSNGHVTADHVTNVTNVANVANV